MRERRYTSPAHAARLESRSEGGLPTIVGVAAVYYDGTPETEFVLWDDGRERVVERIVPGAFDRAVTEDDVRALFNHDPSCLLGRSKAGTLRLELLPTGLGYAIDPPDTPASRTVLEAIRRGDLTGSSFSFDVIAQGWEEAQLEDGRVQIIREVRGVRLFDVGPVTFPAYSGTSAGMRQEGDPAELLEEFRRQRSARAAGVRAAALARAREISLEND